MQFDMLLLPWHDLNAQKSETQALLKSHVANLEKQLEEVRSKQVEVDSKLKYDSSRFSLSLFTEMLVIYATTSLYTSLPSPFSLFPPLLTLPNQPQRPDQPGGYGQAAHFASAWIQRDPGRCAGLTRTSMVPINLPRASLPPPPPSFNCMKLQELYNGSDKSEGR